jgi:hypothetical protein
MQYSRMTATRENPKYKNLRVEECDVLSKGSTTNPRICGIKLNNSTVIGSGPVGATYAREILDPGSGASPGRKAPKVIMVETGAQYGTPQGFLLIQYTDS